MHEPEDIILQRKDKLLVWNVCSINIGVSGGMVQWIFFFWEIPVSWNLKLVPRRSQSWQISWLGEKKLLSFAIIGMSSFDIFTEIPLLAWFFILIRAREMFYSLENVPSMVQNIFLPGRHQYCLSQADWLPKQQDNYSISVLWYLSSFPFISPVKTSLRWIHLWKVV